MSKLQLVVAAGATIETALLPGRLLALRSDYGVSLAVAVSSNALDFTTVTALRGITGRPVYHHNTQFDDASGQPLQVSWCDADLLLLHPATARILSQCALGQVTCAVTRMFAFTPKDRIIVAPSIHPQMDKRLYRGHIDTLRSLGCEVLGDDEMHCDWRDIERRLADRLALEKLSPPKLIRLDELYSSASRGI